MAHYWAIVWIIVAAFLAITVITILGLIQKIQIKPGYMKILFTKMVLGFVAAGFFIFYQGNNVRVEPQEPPRVCLNDVGETTGLTVQKGGEIVLKLPERPEKDFRNIERKVVAAGDSIFVTTARGFVLGYVNSDAAHVSTAEHLTPEMRLHLGLYYASNRSEAGFGQYAVHYLTFVLRDPESKEAQRVKAVRGLYNVVKYIRSTDDFKLLINSLRDLLQFPAKYYEIAETYRIYAEKTESDRDEKFMGALRNYMKYMVKDETLQSGDKLKRIKDNMRYYVGILRWRNDYLKMNAGEIEKDIKNFKRDRLKIHYENLPEPDLDRLE